MNYSKPILKISILSMVLLFCQSSISAQNWPKECKKIEILSSIDQKIQPAYFLKAKGESTRPLIVSLHTWSNGYDQKDTLAKMCADRNYNYIHPHFRGPNNNPEACGSPLAIQDIEDAIAFAIKNAPIDTNEIHITGTSGGGYSTLLMYMKTKYPVKSFAAWVPISDIKRWFYESEGRGNKYALEIAKATNPGIEFTGESYFLGEDEAKKRSPFYLNTPVEKRKNSKLYIFAGIHDGYTGSVPISQSLHFFNKVVKDYDPGDVNSLISDDHILEMVSSRNFTGPYFGEIDGRKIHYQRQYKDLIKIVIFEGTHERLSNIALDHVEEKKILTIGDSNGAAKEGWVNQLKQLRFEDNIHNVSISGNTIGFDNLDREQLNTLKNIDHYLTEGGEKMQGITDIIILLGTNDCKAVFDKQLKKVPQNLETLIQKIKAHSVYQTHQPRIIIVSPPPYGKDEIMLEKYHGAAARIGYLVPKFSEVAKKNGCEFIDIYTPLQPNWWIYSHDGVHLIPEGHALIGTTIHGFLEGN